MCKKFARGRANHNALCQILGSQCKVSFN